MKAVLWILLLLNLLPKKSTAQTGGQAANSPLYFSIGASYRITPIPLRGSALFYSAPVYYERDRHLSGAVLNTGFGLVSADSKYTVELGASFRYDHVYFQRMATASFQEVRQFMSDWHLNLQRIIRLKKNRLRIGTGISFLNNGSTYTYSELSINAAGDTLAITSNDDFRFTAINFIADYHFDPFAFGLIGRYVIQERFFNSAQLLLPELRLTYLIRLRKRKVF